MLSRLAAVCPWLSTTVPTCGLLTTSIALLGATNPLQSAPGTIRGDYAIVRTVLLAMGVQNSHVLHRMSAETSAMAPIASKRPRMRLICGSVRVK